MSAAVLTGGCGDTSIFISTSSDGHIAIIVTSIGSGSDDDGFRVTVDGRTTKFLQPGQGVTLSGLSPGSHTVLLSGLAPNCRVEDPNPRTVLVAAEGTAETTFVVTCESTATGTLDLVVSTTGEPIDGDGYMLVVGEGGTRLIRTTASEAFAGMPPGEHLVMLKDLAQGCELEGGNPQPVVVVGGQTTTVHLTVRCGGVETQ
jgi:hypothetical protein